jgi:flagellar biosynthesis protein FliP
VKKRLVLLSVILATTIFVSSPASASTTSEDLKPYNYENVMDSYFSNIPEKVKNIDVNEVEKESKEYLTDKEITKTTPEMLTKINDKIENNPDMDTYTEHEAKNS